MNYILFYEQKYKEYQTPFLSKSKSNDKNGFNQYIIMKSLKTQDDKLITVTRSSYSQNNTKEEKRRCR